MRKSSAGLFACMLLIGLPYVWPSSPAAAVGDTWVPEFTDDFDDGIADGWTFEATEGGAWSIDSGELSGIAPPGLAGTRASLGGITMGDSRMTYRFKSLSLNGHIQAIFRSSEDRASCYVVSHDTGADWFNLQRYSPANGHQNLIAVSNWPMDDGAWYWVRITAIGGHILVEMSRDGVEFVPEIDHVDESPLAPGTFGFALGEVEKQAHFDDLSIMSLAPVATAAQSWGQLKQRFGK